MAFKALTFPFEQGLSRQGAEVLTSFWGRGFLGRGAEEKRGRGVFQWSVTQKVRSCLWEKPPLAALFYQSRSHQCFNHQQMEATLIAQTFMWINHQTSPQLLCTPAPLLKNFPLSARSAMPPSAPAPQPPCLNPRHDN